MSESFYMRPQSYGYSIVWKRSVIRLKLSIWMNYTRVRNVWFTSLLTIRTNYKRFTSPFSPRALPLSLYHCHLLLCLDECDCFKFIASSEAYYMCQRIYCMIRFGYMNGWREEKKADFGVRNCWNILNDCHAMLFQEHVIIHLMREKRTATNNE